MNIQTGIAVAVAIIVIVAVFFPEYVPLDNLMPSFGTVAGVSIETEEGLKVTDEVEGTGEGVVAGDQVTVNYIGTFEDGTIFDASTNQGGPVSFMIGVGQVIQGWEQGLIGMKEGGKRTLVIPPSLGYGDTGVEGIIPGNSTLIFTVELLDIARPEN